MEKKDRVRVDFGKTTAKVTKTAIVEAVKLLSGKSYLKLNLPEKTIIDSVHFLLKGRITFDGDLRGALFTIDVNGVGSSFRVVEKSNGELYAFNKYGLPGAIADMIRSIPFYVQDNSESVDAFI